MVMRARRVALGALISHEKLVRDEMSKAASLMRVETLMRYLWGNEEVSSRSVMYSVCRGSLVKVFGPGYS